MFKVYSKDNEIRNVNNKDIMDVLLVYLMLTLKFIQVGLYSEWNEQTVGILFKMLIGLHICQTYFLG